MNSILKLGDRDLSSLVVDSSFNVRKLGNLREGWIVVYLQPEGLNAVAEADNSDTFQLTYAARGSPEIITGPAAVRHFNLSHEIYAVLDLTGDWQTLQR